MITVILKGGLGNQMFQYAFAKSLALQKKDNLTINTTFLNTRLPVKNFTFRKYELDLFAIKEKPEGVFLQPFLEEKFGYAVVKIRNVFNSEYIAEGSDPYTYDEHTVNKAQNCANPILEGYFNNYRYFEKQNNLIQKIFDTDTLADPNYKEIEERITSTDSVSINIRRGDYLNSKHKDVFVHLGIDYYKKSIEIIRSKIKKPKFFIFSYDDPEWIQQELKFKKEEIFIVGKEYVGDRFKTYLRLISLCKNNIISNSTFAFWGAFLNKNKDKIVISPKQWMAEYQFENPKDWIEIENV